MADIIDPSQLDAITISAENAKKALEATSTASLYAKDAFQKLYSGAIDINDAYKSFTNTLETTGKFLPQQANQFGLITTALFGVKEAFRGVNLVGDSFTNQINDMVNAASKSNGAIGALSEIALSVFGKVLPDSVKTSVKSAGDFVKSLALSADNALKTRQMYLSLSAATGSLTDVYKTAGPNLENINELILRQEMYMTTAEAATHATAEEVQNYYSQLGKIPGSLNAVIEGTNKSGTQMNMLTAAIKLAQGSGREFSDIVNDLSIAFKDYGLTGEKALIFSARMGDVASSLGLNLKDVQDHLMGAANAFARFADAGDKSLKMSEGLAKITNEYVRALQSTGMSGTQALGVVRGMTDAISNMSIAQKAFLSGQTGGPGGLMGAFQIEKMMREGNVEGVLKKMRDQMKQQFGKIVTLDEASTSQAAAAQMTRQISILKSGPLGGMVKTDQDAYRMLEAFQKMETGGLGGKELATDVLKGSIDKGTDLQKSVATDVGAIRVKLDSMKAIAGVTNLGLIQSTVVAGAGAGAGMKAAAEAGGDKTKMYAAGMEAHAMSSTTSKEITETINNMMGAAKDIPAHLSKSYRNILKAVKNPTEMAAIDAANKELEDSIKMQKAQAKSLPAKQKEAALKAIAEQQKLHDFISGNLTGIATAAPKFPGVGEGMVPPFMPGEVMETAVTTAVKPKGPTTTTAGTGGPGMKPIPITGSLGVTVKGLCLKCATEIKDPNANAILPLKE